MGNSLVPLIKATTLFSARKSSMACLNSGVNVGWPDAARTARRVGLTRLQYKLGVISVDSGSKTVARAGLPNRVPGAVRK